MTLLAAPQPPVGTVLLMLSHEQIMHFLAISGCATQQAGRQYQKNYL